MMMKRSNFAMILGMIALALIPAFASAGELAKISQSAKRAAAATLENGKIFHAQKISYHSDGSISFVSETWADPVTHDQRTDFLEMDQETNSLHRLGGGYVLEDGAKYIKVGTDERSNLTGMVFHGKPGQFSNVLVCDKQDYVNEYKEGTRRSGWKDGGMVNTSGGTEQKILTRIDRSTMPDDQVESYTQEDVYLDKNSGLPVMGKVSIIKNGETALLYTNIYVFNSISDDGSLFDTNGIRLEEEK